MEAGALCVDCAGADAGGGGGGWMYEVVLTDVVEEIVLIWVVRFREPLQILLIHNATLSSTLLRRR